MISINCSRSNQAVLFLQAFDMLCVCAVLIYQLFTVSFLYFECPYLQLFLINSCSDIQHRSLILVSYICINLNVTITLDSMSIRSVFLSMLIIRFLQKQLHCHYSYPQSIMSMNMFLTAFQYPHLTNHQKSTARQQLISIRNFALKQHASYLQFKRRTKPYQPILHNQLESHYICQSYRYTSLQTPHSSDSEEVEKDFEMANHSKEMAEMKEHMESITIEIEPDKVQKALQDYLHRLYPSFSKKERNGPRSGDASQHESYRDGTLNQIDASYAKTTWKYDEFKHKISQNYNRMRYPFSKTDVGQISLSIWKSKYSIIYFGLFLRFKWPIHSIVMETKRRECAELIEDECNTLICLFHGVLCDEYSVKDYEQAMETVKTIKVYYRRQ